MSQNLSLDTVMTAYADLDGIHVSLAFLATGTATRPNLFPLLPATFNLRVNILMDEPSM